MANTNRATKAEVKFKHLKKVYSELDYAESNSSFALQHCYQKISKGIKSFSENLKAIQKLVLIII